MTENEKLHPIFSLQKPWSQNKNSVWLASTISLIRNLEKFKFPAKLDHDRRKQIIALVSKELIASNLLQDPYLIKGEDISPLEKEFLAEHFLSNQNFNQVHSGEGFVIESSGEFITIINLRDHVTFQIIDDQGELESSWNKLVNVETVIGKNLNYSFSHKFGFLTADFNMCGTALFVSVYLQVPALIHLEKINEILDKNADDSLLITGIQGNPTEIIGDVIVVQNNYTLGVTEENIISNLRAFTTKLLVEENSARSHIRNSDNADLKDKVSRAFGILIHSYQIEAIEALNALSLMKLGTEMEWIKGISIQELNQLFFNCRRSHLLSQYPQKISQEEIIHKRAEFIHKTLQHVHLMI